MTETALRTLIEQWRRQADAHLLVAKQLSTTEEGRRIQLALEAARSKCAEELEAALQVASSLGDEKAEWQPIATCQATVTRALILWPAFELDENYEQSGRRREVEDLVAEGYRVGRHQWESDLVTEHLEDEAGFGYGEPTHWMAFPAPPKP